MLLALRVQKKGYSYDIGIGDSFFCFCLTKGRVFLRTFEVES